MRLPESTINAPRPYDRSIHTNPDAAAWARFFVETWPHVYPNRPAPDEGWMLGWFANAMMAMHDFTISDGQSHPAPPPSATAAPAEEIEHGVNCGCCRRHVLGPAEEASCACDGAMDDGCERCCPAPAEKEKCGDRNRMAGGPCILAKGHADWHSDGLGSGWSDSSTGRAPSRGEVG